MTDLEDMRKTWEALPFYNVQEFDKGLELAREATMNWNNQPNPGKVFIKGRRIHHGAAGTGVVLLGIITQSSKILGYAYGLMEDDIGDIDEWFNFEKGGDPNSIFSME